MAEPVLIGFEQQKFIKDTNTKMVSLWTEQAAYDSCKNSAGDYQVPVGKKFIVLKIYVNRNQTHIETPILQESAAADVAGTEIFKGFALNANQIVYDCYIEVTAGKYFGNGNVANITIQVVGIELDA